MSAGAQPEPHPPSHLRAPVGRLSIGEVVALLRPEFNDLTDSKIRFLEDRELISPARTPGGYRSFGPHDIEVLRWILSRQRDQYLPLSIIGERINRGEHLADIWGIGVGDGGPSHGGTGTADPRQVRDRGGSEDAAPEVAAAAEAASDDAAADAAAAAGDTVPDGAAAGEAAGSPGPEPASAQPPWAAPDDAQTYSAAELSAESGLSLAEIAELTEYGLLVPLADDGTPPPGSDPQASLALEPPEPRYGSGALLIARISREFATYGLQARHLRVVRNAAARDAAMFEQGIQPVIHAAGPDAAHDARRSLGRLVALCERLRAQVMGETLRRYWD